MLLAGTDQGNIQPVVLLVNGQAVSAEVGPSLYSSEYPQ